MNLDLATLLNVISTAAIVGALIFTGLQVREANRARRDQTSVVMLQMLLAEGWTRPMSIISKIKFDASAADIEHSSPEIVRALFEFGARLECVGYMVHRHMVELEAMDELMGGATLTYWSRARAWIEAERVRTATPKFMEWVQWLAVRVAARHAEGKAIPAYLRTERSTAAPDST